MICSITFLLLAELEIVGLRNDTEDGVIGFAVLIEQFLRLIGFEPLLKESKFLLVVLGLWKRNLMRAERALDVLAVQSLDTRPSLCQASVIGSHSSATISAYLWRPHDKNWPPGLNNRVTTPCGLLDLVDFI